MEATPDDGAPTKYVATRGYRLRSLLLLGGTPGVFAIGLTIVVIIASEETDRTFAVVGAAICWPLFALAVWAVASIHFRFDEGDRLVVRNLLWRRIIAADEAAQLVIGLPAFTSMNSSSSTLAGITVERHEGRRVYVAATTHAIQNVELVAPHLAALEAWGERHGIPTELRRELSIEERRRYQRLARRSRNVGRGIG